MAAAALPSALRGITATKIVELKKQRKDFEDAKAVIEENVSKRRKTGDVFGQTQALIEGTRSLEGVYFVDPDSRDDENLVNQSGPVASKLRNQNRLLQQSLIDPSLPGYVVSDIQDDLTRNLKLKSAQHEHAELYAKLVTEFVTVGTESKQSPTSTDSPPSQFETVGRKEMHEQRKEWETLAFGTTDVDEAALETYLNNLFTSRSQVKLAFEALRRRLRAFSFSLASEDIFDVNSLQTYAKRLLASDLLNEDKRAILKTFTSNKGVLKEVADVLSMRFRSLDAWQYTTDNGAVNVEQRRQLNGKYRFFLDEDVLDALFIHAIGMKWAVEIRAALIEFQRSHAWSRNENSIPIEDRQRREWFLGTDRNVSQSLKSRRNDDYARHYFMTQLPDNIEDGPRAYDDSDSDDGQPTSDRKNPLETKHSLLHLLVTEALIARHLHPDVEHTVLRSDFKWFGPSLPHTSIFKVLETFGVTPLWLSFFHKFLAAPIRFAQDGPNGAIQTRTRGIPMSMALADVLSESVLFVMDFAVNASTRNNMYRLHDDFWYWNDKDSCRTAWQQMKIFATTMGIELNEEKTGSLVFPRVDSAAGQDNSDEDDMSVTSEPAAPVSDLPIGDIRWGFLKLDPKLCRFTIDQAMVDTHIEELKVQLKAHSTSIFGYIQAYNSYVARFFSNNFGKPSLGFGRAHVDDMITTLRRIHTALYPNGRVTDHLSALTESRFGVKASDLPDGFWFFPVSNGGMDLRNPVVPLVNMRQALRGSPQRILEKAMEREDSDYTAAKNRYEASNSGHGIGRSNFDLKASLGMTGNEKFMSKAEYLKFREERSGNLLQAYESLLEIPDEQGMEATPEIEALVATLGKRRGKEAGAIQGQWDNMDPYWKWVVACFGREICDRYGSLKMVEPAQVPLGVVSVMKAGKVRWEG